MIDFTGVSLIFLIILSAIVVLGVGIAAAVAIGYVLGSIGKGNVASKSQAEDPEHQDEYEMRGTEPQALIVYLREWGAIPRPDSTKGSRLKSQKGG